MGYFSTHVKDSEVVLMLMIVVLLVASAIFYNKMEEYDSITNFQREIIDEKLSLNTYLTSELSWYKEKSREVFGDEFRPGNLFSTKITLTSYNPVEEQCDPTPLISADNGLVSPGIIALPKHYREDLGMPLGQIVWIPPYGQFIVRDHMNNRKPSGRGDIISFIPKWSKQFGKVKDVKMYWVRG